jgi:hypothetical protein
LAVVKWLKADTATKRQAEVESLQAVTAALRLAVEERLRAAAAAQCKEEGNDCRLRGSQGRRWRIGCRRTPMPSGR